MISEGGFEKASQSFIVWVYGIRTAFQAVYICEKRRMKTLKVKARKRNLSVVIVHWGFWRFLWSQPYKIGAKQGVCRKAGKMM